MVDISGLGGLIDQYTGEPAELRWLSIHPDGRVAGRRSDNRIAWWVRYEMWVQFCLLRDVYRVVAPLDRGFGVQSAGLMIDTPGHGVVIVKRRPGPAQRGGYRDARGRGGRARGVRHGGVDRCAGPGNRVPR